MLIERRSWLGSEQMWWGRIKPLGVAHHGQGSVFGSMLGLRLAEPAVQNLDAEFPQQATCIVFQSP
jgi:hypothetical protein